MSQHPTLPDIFQRKARPPSPQYTNRCSGIGHPCVLYSWFCRTRWDMRKQFNDVLLRIFREGDLWHKRVAAGFAQSGVEYIRQEEPMRWDNLELTGHMDGVVLPCSAVPELGEKDMAVVDVKGMSDYAFASINTLRDLRESTHWYHRAYVTQPSLYAIHDNVRASWCVIYKVKRSTAETGQIWWQPELDAAEEIVTAREACKKINEAIKRDARDAAGELLAPSQLSNAGAWCDDCPFGSVCPEFMMESKGIRIAPPEIVDLVNELQAFKPIAKSVGRIEQQLRKHWSNVKEGSYICGEYTARVSKVEPKERAAKPAYKPEPYFRTTYKDTGAVDDK